MKEQDLEFIITNTLPAIAPIDSTNPNRSRPKKSRSRNASKDSLGRSSKHQKRNKTFKLRLTDDELTQLHQKCQGTSKSNYIRAKIFDHPVPKSVSIPPQINRESYVALAGIRRDITRLTRELQSARGTGESALKFASLYDTLMTKLGEIDDAVRTSQRAITQQLAQASPEELDDDIEETEETEDGFENG